MGRRLLFRLLWIFCCGVLCCRAQECASGNGVVPVHIAVLVRGLDGEPVAHLGSSDFELEGAGVRFPVSATAAGLSTTVAARPLPAHILLVIPSQSAYATAQEVASLLAQELPAVFDHSSVAVLMRDGTMTAYETDRAGVIAAVRNPHPRRAGGKQALRELGELPGRRVVVFLSDSGLPVPTPLRRAAQQVGAMVYQAGGDRSANYVRGGEATTVPPVFAAGTAGFGSADQGGIGVTAPPETFAEISVKSVRDVEMERSLKAAFRKIRKDGRGFYDLFAPVPAGVAALELKVRVHSDYQVTAQVYTWGDGACLPVLRLPTKQ